MAITIDNKTYRNIQEQVLKNAQDIDTILKAEKVLADFGIKVIGHLDSAEDLPEDYLGDYGDAYTVGESVPYQYHVWTRPGGWFLIGTFPQPGPQGPQGEQGEQGPQGPQGTALLSGTGSPSSSGLANQLYLNTTTGTIYKYVSGAWVTVGNIKGPQGEQGIQGPQGAAGPQGIQGPQGPRGDVGGFINIQGVVTSTSELPNPSTITDRTWAFLVGDDRLLYVQVPVTPGSSTYQWQNFGELNVGTYCTVGGNFVNVFNLDSKLSAVRNSSSYEQVYAKTKSGNQQMMSVSTENSGGTIVQRTGSGQVRTATPTAANDAANKSYVDNKSVFIHDISFTAISPNIGWADIDYDIGVRVVYVMLKVVNRKATPYTSVQQLLDDYDVIPVGLKYYYNDTKYYASGLLRHHDYTMTMWDIDIPNRDLNEAYIDPVGENDFIDSVQ